MKSYKTYDRDYIGMSDYATLILAGVGEHGLVADALSFGEDNDYYAYVVDKDAKIGDHYYKVASFRYWLKIYDDDGLAIKFEADEIIVYRAGEMGCIVQLIEGGEGDE